MQKRISHILTNSPGKQDLHKACGEICRNFGFQHFLLISKTRGKSRPRLIIIQGSEQKNADSCYETHGVMRVSARTNSPGSDIDSVLDHFSNDQQQQLVKVLLSNQVNIPLVNSISFPVFGEDGDIGVLIFTTSIDPSRQATTNAQLSYAQEFAHSIHIAAINSALKDNQAVTQKLTGRELECLRWAAQGKTNWEIGQILEVTKRTVVFHLQNSAKKLQTSNRYHTVARAISLGLVPPLS